LRAKHVPAKPLRASTHWDAPPLDLGAAASLPEGE